MATLDKEKAWSDFRVGLMTFMGLFLLILGIIFAGGSKGLLFQKTVFLKALFHDVNGLKTGSPVAMGGMTIGKVTSISFSQAPEVGLIEVIFQIRADIRDRIKKDSVPAIRTQGMLGDRFVDLSMGSKDSPPLADGEFLTGEETADFDKALRQSSAVMKEAETLLDSVNKQRGTVGRLFYDQNLYQKFTELAGEFSDLLRDFRKQPRKYIKLSIF